MEAAISFRDVCLRFEDGDIVQGLSFEVFPRETLVLLGETGTGKTLSLKMAAGLLRPQEGEVMVLGRRVSEMKEKDLLTFRREIGFVFQEGALFDSMTVEENVAYRLREEQVPEEEIGPKVRESLRFVELEQAIDQVPSELSGGMRRRVSIARALITRPPILRLRDTYGVTALLATHRLQDGFALANFYFDAARNQVLPNHKRSGGKQEAESATRFAVLRDGKVFFQGNAEELSGTGDPYLKRFLV